VSASRRLIPPLSSPVLPPDDPDPSDPLPPDDEPDADAAVPDDEPAPADVSDGDIVPTLAHAAMTT
jgi:hypothetical protein